MVGRIFDIQRFCLHDGPGIRTTIFFKGCPLRCLWCHNPESQKRSPEIFFYKERCTGCGECTHRSESESMDVTCPNRAKERCGREMTSDELLEWVLKDRIFYQNSQGGVTLSGGEPLEQPEFCRELLEKCKRQGLHTAIETCGYADASALADVAPYTDLFLFDYKETDPKRHQELTGVRNERILERLDELSLRKKPVILRCPIVKGANMREEHLDGIARLAEKYENILQIELEPYHPLGNRKYEALGRSLPPFCVSTDEEKQAYCSALQQKTGKKVLLS